MFPILSRAESDWAAKFIAQQYFQNVRRSAATRERRANGTAAGPRGRRRRLAAGVPSHAVGSSSNRSSNEPEDGDGHAGGSGGAGSASGGEDE